MDPTTFTLFDILPNLYREFSEHLGTGEEETGAVLMRGTFRLRALRPDHPSTGFEGAIGLREEPGYTAFRLYGRFPRKEDRGTVAEPNPVLELHAQSSDGGIWRVDKGNLYHVTVTAEFGHYGLNLSGLCVRFALICIARASALVRDPECAHESYWDGSSSPP